MLCRLSVKNLALLKDTEIEFGPGFTAITGETGSGKTLLVEAMSFLAGSKANPGLVRDGAGMAVVEAEFVLHTAEKTILRRELQREGRTRSFVNDSLSSIKDLSIQASRLFDITSQRAFSHLLEPARHLDFLDQFAGLGSERRELVTHESENNKLKRKITQVAHAREQFKQRQEIIEFQIKQIDSVDPQPEEEEELASEIRRIEHFEDIHRDGSHLIQVLVDDASSAEAQILAASKLLKTIVQIDSSLGDLQSDLESAAVTVKEIARQVERRCLHVDYEVEKLESLRERQYELAGLIRKFGGTFAAMLEHRNRLRVEMKEAEINDSEIDELQRQWEVSIRDWSNTSKRVSDIRKKRAIRLEKQVEHSLSKLGVKSPQFRVYISKLPAVEGLYEEDGIKWSMNGRGIDNVEFFFSANPGLEPRPLGEVASGGELSRLLLALKEALPVISTEATVIFDEIDAGVSSRIAHLVGQKIRELSKARQMIAITHLPQIAGAADCQICVRKSPDRGETVTSVQILDSEQRIEEIAYMLSDGNVTEAAVQQAKNLLGSGSG